MPASLNNLDRAELEGVLIDVAQLIDGWRADSAWTEWDEEVRYRVHCQLARLNGVVPIARAAFTHTKDQPNLGSIQPK